jgi:hypothetical protein
MQPRLRGFFFSCHCRTLADSNVHSPESKIEGSTTVPGADKGWAATQLNLACMWATMAGLSDDMLKSLVAELKTAQVRKRERESAPVGFEAKARQKLSLPEPEDLVAEILSMWEVLTTLPEKEMRKIESEKLTRFTEARLERLGQVFRAFVERVRIKKGPK